MADLARMQQETWCFAIWHLGYLLRLCVTIPQSEQESKSAISLRMLRISRNVVNTRYRLVPYLYSEYMKAALNDDMYFKPLGFVYPDDKMAIRVEDQLILGNEIMIAPVYEQNARGRYVYLPEEMRFVKFLTDGSISEEILEKGVHYVEVALNEVPLFIRSGKCIPVAEAAECVKDIDTSKLTMLGYEGSSYTLYEDDGVHKEYDKAENYRKLEK